MRAAKSILASLVLLFSSMPALAIFPGWQQHAPPSRSAQQAPPGSRAMNGPPRSSPQSSRPMNGPPRSSPQGPNGGNQLHLNGPGPHRGDWLRKYMALPPQQQERQLQQDPSFRSLPPDKQNHLLNRFTTSSILSSLKIRLPSRHAIYLSTVTSSASTFLFSSLYTTLCPGFMMPNTFFT